MEPDKYWMYALFVKDDKIIEGLITHDGFLIKLKMADAIKFLQNLPKDTEGWFFNESRDRYIAGEKRVS